MSKENFNPAVELISLESQISLNEFFSINIWMSSREIRLQGYLNSATKDAAKALNIKLLYDNTDGFLRGSNGNIHLTLSER